MAQTFLREPLAFRPDRVALRLPRHPAPSSGGAARGIMIALALSSLGWVALALLVPRFW
jgi:hypothetical protein